MERRPALIVEDDPTMLGLLTDLIEGEGYAVTGTDSVLGAMGLVRQIRPCIILLDLGLPYRSGASLLADLKAEAGTARIPVVVVSGLPEALTAERRALATAVVEKPFTVDALLEAVRAACDPAP